MVDKPYGKLVGVRPGKLVDQLLEYGLPPQEIVHRLQLERKVRRDKAELLVQVSLNQRRTLAETLGRRNLFSLYVGIPFCPSRCAYCSFASHSLEQYKAKDRQLYFDGLLEELEFLKAQVQDLGLKLCSVYIGGGTPTTLEESQLATLSAFIEGLPWWEGKREVTLEAGRPDTITGPRLQSFSRKTRVSINPQSMHDATLAAIGRSHSVDAVRESFKLVQEMGFNNINADLIIGLPGEEVGHITESVQQVLALKPASVTLHMFSPKRASAYAKGGQWQPMNDEAASAAGEVAAGLLSQAGMYPYYLYRQRGILGGLENTGWALPGYESLYNMLVIAENQLVLGAGAGASSKFVEPKEPWSHHTNPKDAKVYLKRLPETLEHKKALFKNWRNSLC